MIRRGLSARLERQMEQVAMAFKRQEQMADEYKIFIREMNRRNEKVVQDLVRHSEEARAENAQHTATIIARLRELTEESRAQREGLLAVIDRFPPKHDS